MSIMNFALTVLRNLRSVPATRMYPVTKRAAFQRTRGSIGISIRDCIFCGQCQRRCPAAAIAVDKPERTWTINRLKCVQCNSCVEVCPKKCLTMRNAYTQPSLEQSVEVFRDA